MNGSGSMLIMLVIMIGGLWLMSSFARRQQKKMADQQAQRTEEALVPGTWVRTTAGFYGTVVEVDGDVVTLATPLGDETLWLKRSIVGAEEPPFASTQEADATGVAEETDVTGTAEAAADSEPTEPAGPAEPTGHTGSAQA